MEAFDWATDQAVRAVLIALCDDMSVRRKALEYLDKVEPKAWANAIPISVTHKRKAHPGLRICIQCGDAFDETDNATQDCAYHSGTCL